MPTYTIVLLGAACPDTAAVRDAAEELGAEFAMGESASKLLLFDPDVALVHVSRPAQLDALSRMVRRRGEQLFPILAVVPRDANGLLEEARSRGADGFLFTPVQPTAASATLEAYARLSCLERDRDAVVRPTQTYHDEVDEWMALISSAPNLILRLDRSGRVNFSNRKKFLGEAPMGRDIREVLANLDGRFARTFRRAVDRGLPGYFDTTAEDPKLGLRHYLLFLGPIVGGGGVSGVAVVVVDVTEQRDVTAVLREGREQLQTLLEAAPGSIGIVDRQGVVLFQSREGMLAADDRERGLTLLDAVSDEDRPRVEAALDAALRTGESRSVTYRVDDVWYDARMRRVLYDGEARVAVFATNVTERVETEGELRRKLRQIDVLQSHLPITFFEGSFARGTGGELRVDGLETAGGGDATKTGSLNISDHMERVHPDDRDRMRRDWERFAAGQIDEWEHEYRVQVADGQFRWLMARGFRSERDRMVGFALDVTERKLLEDRLVQASKMEAIGRLAGGVAHDFNNLLTSIVNFTWYVRDELPSESPLREDLGEVLKAAESGARLTSQLLAFSRRKPSEPTVVELNERIDQVYRVLERTIGENIRLVFNRSPAQLPVVVEPSQLDQMIFNLAVNARDAMPSGGTLTLTLRRSGEMAVIEVADDGIGIPRDIQNRLFEPFFSTKGENGTGLGLATCYGIARQAGGDIDVRSAPGEGASFIVSLPLAARDDAPFEDRPATATRAKPLSLALVVEDQPAILKLVHRALEHAGWDVHTAASAEEALEIAAGLGRQPAVLLTDVVLPGKSGVDLARELRERWPDLPVLLTSGYLGDEYEPAMATGGRTAFVPKPFNSVQLLSRLAMLLE